MSVDRRSFLQYVGFGAAALTLAPWTRVAAAAARRRGLWMPDGAPTWTSPRYPIPLPGDAFDASTDAARLARYEVTDDLTLPEGFTYDVLVVWGDVIERDDGQSFEFGFNCDFTGLIPIEGHAGESLLVVNHEYVSARPWIDGLDAVGRLDSIPSVRVDEEAGLMIGGRAVPFGSFPPDRMSDPLRRDVRALARSAMDTLGVSVVHVRRADDGRLSVVQGSSRHRRVSGVSSIGFDEALPLFTGPATHILGDGRAVPPRTFANCSGGVTPWGTVLTCEENYQDQLFEYVDRGGAVTSDGRGRERSFGHAAGYEGHDLPFEFEGLGAADPTLDPRSFGWVAEIDPLRGTMRKHTALGRFRHENVALRCEKSRRLAAYMGDDRRGGHVWKFVSDGTVSETGSPRNSTLLEEGTLHVAAFNPDFTGEWIPLTPATPLMRPDPTACSTLWLPEPREGGAILVGLDQAMTFDAWIAAVEAATGRSFDTVTLGDLVDGPTDDARQGTILLGAYLMANAAGGTPSARPEDIEVHPLDQSVYIAFTDAVSEVDGSPDPRIFTEEDQRSSRRYGALHRLVEEGDDPAALTFTWGRFVASGEVAEGGGGFACADNLVFDDAANLWMVTDISTSSHNFEVDRVHTVAGSSAFRGIFGNNALFCIPTSGPDAGVPTVFAIGPSECELTGPTITPDGDSLILAVQHPGELNGHRGKHGPLTETRTYEIADRDGSIFTQTREVPIGSNFPGGGDTAPRPAVVQIRRTRA